MIFLIVGGILFLLTLLVTRTKGLGIRFIYGLTWIVGLVTYVNARPSSVIAGSSLDIAIIVIIIGIALVLCFWAFTNNIKVTDTINIKNGGIKNISMEHNKWQAPGWISGLGGNKESEESFATRFRKTYNQGEYRNRLHRALNQKRENR